METNDSEARSSLSTDDGTFKRHSNRIKKPINLFEPKPLHPKPKKTNLSVSCKILKTKGISISSKQLDFPLKGNMPARKVVQDYLKKIKFHTLGWIVVYFCEETQSIYYLDWKKFKRTDQFRLGNTYKIRVVKLKKPEKAAKPKTVEEKKKKKIQEKEKGKKTEQKIENKGFEVKETQNLVPKMSQNDVLQYMMYIQNCLYQDYSMRMAWLQGFS